MDQKSENSKGLGNPPNSSPNNPNNPKTLILGVDPGLSGALALYDSSTARLLTYKDMPTSRSLTGKKLIDCYDLAMWVGIHADRILFAVVEDVASMTYVTPDGQVRGQGAASSFAFGKSAGQIHGILSANMVPILFVKPAVWKCAMNLSSNKRESCLLARKYFPYFSMAFMRLKDADRAEAALLAVFGSKHEKAFSLPTIRR